MFLALGVFPYVFGTIFKPISPISMSPAMFVLAFVSVAIWEECLAKAMPFFFGISVTFVGLLVKISIINLCSNALYHQIRLFCRKKTSETSLELLFSQSNFPFFRIQSINQSINRLFTHVNV